MSDKSGRIDTFVNRLNKAMSNRGMSQVDLVQQTGLRKQQISQYVNGLFEAKQKALYLLSQALNVSEAWLMGYDVPMEKDTPINFYNSGTSHETSLLKQIENYYGKDATLLLMSFVKLNEVGREKALENISDLAALPKYTEKRSQESLNA